MLSVMRFLAFLFSPIARPSQPYCDLRNVLIGIWKATSSYQYIDDSKDFRFSLSDWPDVYLIPVYSSSVETHQYKHLHCRPCRLTFTYRCNPQPIFAYFSKTWYIYSFCLRPQIVVVVVSVIWCVHCVEQDLTYHCEILDYFFVCTIPVEMQKCAKLSSFKEF